MNNDAAQKSLWFKDFRRFRVYDVLAVNMPSVNPDDPSRTLV